MIKLKEDKKVYNIPNTWSNVTVKQLGEIVKYIQKVSGIEGYPDDMIYANLFQILTSGTQEDYKELSLINGLNFMSAVSFILTEEIKEEKYDGNVLIGDLTLKVKNFEDFKYNEFLDVNQLASSGKEHDLITMVAVMSDVYQKRDFKKLRFKPKKMEYSLDKKIMLIHKMPATKFRAINDFFLSGQKQYGSNMVSSMVKVANRLVMKARLRMAGVIISGLWMRVVKMLRKWMRFLVNPFAQSLRT